MKNIRRISIAVAVLLLEFYSAARSQSLSINSVSATTMCAGDPVSVTFTAIGTWGHNNAFTVQLSDTNGNFGSVFTNLGSLKDTVPGTFTIVSTIPDNAFSSHNYRFRVLGAVPYMASADNGSGISIGALPSSMDFVSNIGNVVVGSPVGSDVTNPGSDASIDSVFWDFGADATPSTAKGVGFWNGGTVYSAGGIKTITVTEKLPGGCSRTISRTFRVYDCTTPAIPSNSSIADHDMTWHNMGKLIWVNPGVKLTLFSERGDTVFAEAGSTITDWGGWRNIVYLNAGASYVTQGTTTEDVIIYSDSASVPTVLDGATLECHSLHFDYSKAPPNSVMHINDSVPLISEPSLFGTQYCAGDSISVSFNVGGSWKHNNAFTLELSDTSGSFSNKFTILGSVIDSVPGTYSIASIIPIKTAYSTKYRVRVTGAYPYTESADNGSNIQIGDYPLKVLFSDYGAFPAKHPVEPLAIRVPRSLQFVTADAVGLQDYGVLDSVFVSYGDGASPPFRTFSGISLPYLLDKSYSSVVYSTGGLKQLVTQSVTKGGCSISDTFWVYVYDCTIPTIPHDAEIISSNGQTGSSFKSYWVNPGITFTTARFDTVFAETGAQITGSNGQTEAIVYLKPGATSDIDINGIVIYAPSAGVDNSGSDGVPTLECTDLSFDYSVAPPNSVMHINEAVTPVAPVAEISVLPDPTTGMVTIENVPAYANVTVMNVLGKTIEQMNANASGTSTVDLTNALQGTYYIRIASGSSVVTKKVVKE